MPDAHWWVVEFGDCGEAVLRFGTEEEVAYEDDLGCPFSRVIPRAQVKITARWIKNGVDRVEYELAEPTTPAAGLSGG